MTTKSLETYRQTQNGVGRTAQWEKVPEEDRSNYVSLPRTEGEIV